MATGLRPLLVAALATPTALAAGAGNVLSPATPAAGCDLAYALPVTPRGLAADGADLLLEIDRETGGVLRLRASGSSLTFSVLPDSTLPPSGGKIAGVDCAAAARGTGRAYCVDLAAKRVLVFTESAGSTRLDGTFPLPLADAVGIAWDGTRLWIADRATRTLQRLAVDGAPQTSVPPPSPEDVVAQLSRALRDESPEVRTLARAELLARGHPVDYDRYDAPGTPDLGPERVEVLMASVEVRGDRLLGSWLIHVGSTLIPKPGVELPGGLSCHARYRITVAGEALPEPAVHEADAVAGMNEERDVLLATGVRPGRVAMEVYVDVRYLDGEGRYRTLEAAVPMLSVVAGISTAPPARRNVAP